MPPPSSAPSTPCPPTYTHTSMPPPTSCSPTYTLPSMPHLYLAPPTYNPTSMPPLTPCPPTYAPTSLSPPTPCLPTYNPISIPPPTPYPPTYTPTNMPHLHLAHPLTPPYRVAPIYTNLRQDLSPSWPTPQPVSGSQLTPLPVAPLLPWAETPLPVPLTTDIGRTYSLWCVPETKANHIV